MVMSHKVRFVLVSAMIYASFVACCKQNDAAQLNVTEHSIHAFALADSSDDTFDNLASFFVFEANNNLFALAATSENEQHFGLNSLFNELASQSQIKAESVIDDLFDFVLSTKVDELVMTNGDDELNISNNGKEPTYNVIFDYEIDDKTQINLGFSGLSTDTRLKSTNFYDGAIMAGVKAQF